MALGRGSVAGIAPEPTTPGETRVDTRPMLLRAATQKHRGRGRGRAYGRAWTLSESHREQHELIKAEPACGDRPPVAMPA
jgi:hypothetical protein